MLLAVLASAWATHAVGLSLALGAFLAGMMLAETEFRHQVEATIRSYREVLLGLFFITVGMLLDVGLLLRHFPLVAAILAGHAADQGGRGRRGREAGDQELVQVPAHGRGREPGRRIRFRTAHLVLRRELLDPDVAQPLLAAIVLSMVLSPLLIRHNRRITRTLLGQSGPPNTELMRETRATLAVAERDHVVICGFGRVGQNIARVLEQTGFEYIALDLDAYRIRVGGRPAIRSSTATRAKSRCWKTSASAGPAAWSSHLPTPRWRCASCGRYAICGADVPILVRTQDDSKLEQLQAAGATEVVPETFEASLMLLSHLLLLLKLPVPRVIRTVNDIRSSRYGMLRQYFRDADAEHLDDTHAFREELHSVILPPNAWAVGRSIADLADRGSRASVSAVRRDGIVGREPSPDTLFKEGDVVVVCGTPEAVEHAETLLLMAKKALYRHAASVA